MNSKTTNDLQKETQDIARRGYNDLVGSLRREEELLVETKRKLCTMPTSVAWVLAVGGTLVSLASGALLGKVLYDSYPRSPPAVTATMPEETSTRDYLCVTEGRGSSAVKYLDKAPFGSLDDVTFVQDGKVRTLHPGERGFGSYANRYNSQPNPFVE